MVRAEMTVTKNHVRISQNVVEIHGFQHFAVRAACQTCYRVWPVPHANSMSVRDQNDAEEA